MDAPTYRLPDGTKRELYAPTWRERADAWGDEIERQERLDREREKGE